MLKPPFDNPKMLIPLLNFTSAVFASRQTFIPFQSLNKMKTFCFYSSSLKSGISCNRDLHILKKQQREISSTIVFFSYAKLCFYWFFIIFFFLPFLLLLFLIDVEEWPRGWKITKAKDWSLSILTGFCYSVIRRDCRKGLKQELMNSRAVLCLRFDFCTSSSSSIFTSFTKTPLCIISSHKTHK